MAKRDVMKGTWTGKLVDVQGFEGDVHLQLEGKGESLRGSFRASLLAHHDAIPVRGSVRGKLARDRLRLTLAAGDDFGAEFDAKLLDLSAGGSGLCGTYEVSGRAFSPLHGGIAVLNRGVPITDLEIKPQSAGRKP